MSYTADTGGQNMLRIFSSMCCNKEDSQSDCNSCTCTRVRVYDRSNSFCKLHGSTSEVFGLTWAERMRYTGLATVRRLRAEAVLALQFAESAAKLAELCDIILSPLENSNVQQHVKSHGCVRCSKSEWQWEILTCLSQSGPLDRNVVTSYIQIQKVITRYGCCCHLLLFCFKLICLLFGIFVCLQRECI